MRKCLLTFCLLVGVPAWSQTVAIRAGNLIDPANGSVARNQIILVKDKKVVDVGATVAVPPDSQVVDLSKEWVMSGVMDAHTHVTWSMKYFSEGDHT